MHGRRRAIAIFLAVALAVMLLFVLPPYLHGAAFVVRAAGIDGAAARVAKWDEVPVAEHNMTVPSRFGPLRAREYTPVRGLHRRILLVPGVHAAGIDEPRLVGFAREVAAEGHQVTTVQLDDLTHYAITTRTTDMIEDAAVALAKNPASPIGLMGISFGGGLSVVAAGRPSLKGRLAFVMAFGGHADLPRTLRYLCTGIQPDGVRRPPHDYGLAIVLLGVADRVVPRPQVASLRAAILSYLEASRLDMVDKGKAALEFAHAKALEATLDEPSRTYMRFVNERDVRDLGPVLLPYVSELGGDPALSPDRSPPPTATVYLLHGTDDNVIPAIESTLLARDLEARGVRVHLLLTPLITHAEVDRSSTTSAIWRLIDFWAKLLDD